MQELVALMEKYQPGISASFVPTPEDDIAKMVAIAGPLPGAYLRFLRTMGASTGDFKIDMGNADWKTDEMWLVYEAFPWLQEGGRFVYIGQDNSPSAGDWFLDRRAPSGEDDCLVVSMTLEQDLDATQAEERHIGLEELLYYEAFYGLRLPQFEHHRQLRQVREGAAATWPRPEAVCALAEKLGFQRIPRVAHSALYERGDAALLLYRHPTKPTFSFILSGDDEKAVEAMVDEFMKIPGVLVDDTHPM